MCFPHHRLWKLGQILKFSAILHTYPISISIGVCQDQFNDLHDPFFLFIAIECPCLWGHQLARFSKSSLAPKLLVQEMLAKRDRNLTSFKQLFLAQWLLIFPFSSDRKSSVSSKIISKGPHRLKIILRDYRLAFYHFESISVWTKPQVNLVYENQMNSILECSFHPSN